MGNLTDKQKGELAENNFCNAVIEMGGGILKRPYRTDFVEHIDVTPFGVEYYADADTFAGMVSEGRWDEADYLCRVKMINVDVKWAENAPDWNKAHEPRGAFFIEWKSGEKGLATPLSDEDTLTTHIALCRMKENESYIHRPFWLLNVSSLREFYTKYNDGSGKYIRPTQYDSSAHGALIDSRKFAEEYGAYYFSYNAEAGMWVMQTWASTDTGVVERDMYAPYCSMLAVQMQGLIDKQKAAYEQGRFKAKDWLMDKDTTARMFYGGDKAWMEKKMSEEVKHYAPKYELLLPRGHRYKHSSKRSNAGMWY